MFGAFFTEILPLAVGYYCYKQLTVILFWGFFPLSETCCHLFDETVAADVAQVVLFFK